MTSDIAETKINFDKRPLLTISLVTYNPDYEELQKTLDSLKLALEMLPKDSYKITVIDNSISEEVISFLQKYDQDLPIRILHGQGNVGFGHAHNLAFTSMGEFHLILNPDIQLSPDALIKALNFMEAYPQCGLLSPYATWPNGTRQYLCKRYPALFDLFLRGFAPRAMQSFFSKRMARHELRHETQLNVYWNPPLVSGCFMFFRSSVLEKIGGFSDDFFLYFEDFDLSLRSCQAAKTAYVPTVVIVHSGGHAARKGFQHIKVFLKSAVTFYRKHGLKII
jgi:GT2 family glycosyltransferase